MSATDEIRRAAADLRKAAQLRKDELRDHHVQLDKAKNDHDHLITAIRTEQGTLERRLKDPNDDTLQNDMKSQVEDVKSKMVRYQDDHEKTVNSIESRIRQLEQEINQYEQQAAQLEQQAV